MLWYAGIGTRNPSGRIAALARKVARYQASCGYVLRTGGAPGIDQLMTQAALEIGGRVVLCLPWDTFSRDWVANVKERFEGLLTLEALQEDDEEAFQAVDNFHPNPDALKRNARRFHARNYRILVPYSGGVVRQVVAAPRNNSGGTMQGIRIAEVLDIPTVRLDALSPSDVQRRLDKPDRGKACVPAASAASTLVGAQKLVQAVLVPGVEGIDCPCCRQRVQLYRRKLNSKMAHWLIMLTRAFLSNGRKWVSVKDYPLKDTRGGDYAKLLHWGLIESRPNKNKKKRTSGYWRPTRKGVAFAKARIQVPSHLYVFNNTVYATADETITIQDALGTEFDYRELVRAPLKDIPTED